MSDETIKKYGCLTKTHKCKYLKEVALKDMDGVYRWFYQCVSEDLYLHHEKLACGCCKEMEEIK